MTTRFLKDHNYCHRNDPDVYMNVIDVVDYDDHFKLLVIWREKKTNKPIFGDAFVTHVLRNSLHEWFPWQK